MLAQFIKGLGASEQSGSEYFVGDHQLCALIQLGIEKSESLFGNLDRLIGMERDELIGHLLACDTREQSVIARLQCKQADALLTGLGQIYQRCQSSQPF